MEPTIQICPKCGETIASKGKDFVICPFCGEVIYIIE
jgi:tRNA(Ile2) C34 agmatinyltransferase TiaS